MAAHLAGTLGAPGRAPEPTPKGPLVIVGGSEPMLQWTQSELAPAASPTKVLNIKGDSIAVFHSPGKKLRAKFWEESGTDDPNATATGEQPASAPERPRFRSTDSQLSTGEESSFNAAADAYARAARKLTVSHYSGPARRQIVFQPKQQPAQPSAKARFCDRPPARVSSSHRNALARSRMRARTHTSRARGTRWPPSHHRFILLSSPFLSLPHSLTHINTS